MASKSRMVTLVPIKQMDRAIKFYRRAFGAKVTYRGRGEMKDFWASLEVGGADVWLVVNPKAEKRKLAYQALLVKDIKSYVKALQKKRVKFEKPEPMGPDATVDGPVVTEQYGANAFLKDSEGNLWMLWQNFPPM
jgi:predicted enzyme related to lactoylglutathione lyase